MRRKYMLKFIGLVMLLTARFFVHAQSCTPDQSYTEPGFYPDTLPHGEENVAYSHTLHIRVIEDTIAVVGGQNVLADIDSAVLEEIIGLPDGFTYSCDKPGCVYIPDSVGCATLVGTPKPKDVGTYDLKMVVALYATIYGSFSAEQTDTLDQFTLTINGDGIASIQNNRSINIRVYPNPGNGFYRLSERVSFAVFDYSGKEVLKEEGKEVDLRNFENGVYTLTIFDGSTRRTVRLLKI
jgi:hypothetical protein